MDPDELEHALARLDERERGWFKNPLPTPFDQTAARVVDAYVGGDDPTKAAVVDGINLDRAGTLSAYAERMASLAVHERSPDPLVRGLVAIGLAATQLYNKELLILLPLFRRSAERLGIDGTLLFTSAADLLGDDSPSWIRAFPNRDPADQTLAAMRYEEHDEPNGLLYRRAFG